MEADRISHISLQHVFHVSLLCESAKHSMHPGRVPGLLGKPDFQLALYATIKIIRPYENTQQTVPLCMFWCEKASAPKFSTRHDLYLGTLQAPPSHCAPIIETPYTDQQIFKFYRYITLRNFLVKQKWHSCLMGTRKILGKQFVWVRQLQLIFHLFFFLKFNVLLKIILSEHTHGARPTHYFISIRCVGGFLKTTISYCIFFFLRVKLLSSDGGEIKHSECARSLSLLVSCYKLLTTAKTHPFLERGQP